jgi:hypothetical protein
VKKANGYWQLGRLGPEETEELQAKVSWPDERSIDLLGYRLRQIVGLKV